MKDLLLSDAIRRQIESEGAKAFPNECCGMMVGVDTEAGRIVERIEPADNSFEAGEQYHRFSIPPLQQMKAERRASNEGKTLIGFYHSHPDHPARPSEYDREHAWETFSYVIVEIRTGQPREMTSWMLDAVSRTFSQQTIR